MATRHAQQCEASVRVSGCGRSELFAVHSAAAWQRHGTPCGLSWAGLHTYPDCMRASIGGCCGHRWLDRWHGSRSLDAATRWSIRSVSPVAAATLVQGQELPCLRCAPGHSCFARDGRIDALAIAGHSFAVAQEAALISLAALVSSVVLLVVSGRGKLLLVCSPACLAANTFAVSLAMQFGARLLVRAPDPVACAFRLSC